MNPNNYIQLIDKYENLTDVQKAKLQKDLQTGSLLYPGIIHDVDSHGESFYRNKLKNDALFFLEADYQTRLLADLSQIKNTITLLDKFKDKYIIDTTSKLKSIMEWINNYSNKYLYYNSFAGFKYLETFDGKYTDSKLAAYLGDSDKTQTILDSIRFDSIIKIPNKVNKTIVGHSYRIYEITNDAITVDFTFTKESQSKYVTVASNKEFIYNDPVNGKISTGIIYVLEGYASITIKPEDGIVDCLIECGVFEFSTSKYTLLTQPVKQGDYKDFTITTSIPSQYYKMFYIKTINNIIIEEEINGFISNIESVDSYLDITDKNKIIFKKLKDGVNIKVDEVTAPDETVILQNNDVVSILYGVNAVEVKSHEIKENAINTLNSEIIMDFNEAFMIKTEADDINPAEYDLTKMEIYYPINSVDNTTLSDVLVLLVDGGSIKKNVLVKYFDGSLLGLKIFTEAGRVMQKVETKDLDSIGKYSVAEIPYNGSVKTIIYFNEKEPNPKVISYRTKLSDLIRYFNYSIINNELEGIESDIGKKTVSNTSTALYYWDGYNYIAEDTFVSNFTSIYTNIYLQGKLTIQKTLVYKKGNVSVINNSLNDKEVILPKIKTIDTSERKEVLADKLSLKVNEELKIQVIGDDAFISNLLETLIDPTINDPNLLTYTGINLKKSNDNTFNKDTFIMKDSYYGLGYNPILDLTSINYIVSSKYNMIPISFKLKPNQANVESETFQIRIETSYEGLGVNYLGITAE